MLCLEVPKSIWIDRDRSRAVSRWVQLDIGLVSLRGASGYGVAG